MKRNLKIFAIMMSTVMIFNSIAMYGHENKIVKANEKQLTRDYVILTQSEKETEEILKKYDFAEIVSDKTEENLVITAELTERDAREIQKKDANICVEPDVEVKGCGYGQVKRMYKK